MEKTQVALDSAVKSDVRVIVVEFAGASANFTTTRADTSNYCGMLRSKASASFVDITSHSKLRSS